MKHLYYNLAFWYLVWLNNAAITNAGLSQGDVLEIFQPDSEHADVKPRLLVMVSI